MGTIVETTVLRHLFAYYYRDTPEIVYWRDAATRKEVDIIVRSPAYVLPFEVKYKSVIVEIFPSIFREEYQKTLRPSENDIAFLNEIFDDLSKSTSIVR